MEDHLVETLNLPAGAKVLDAGCGVGHVAMHLARKGLRVQGIDVVDRHIQKAQRYIQADGLEGRVKVRKMDYHHLDEHADKSFDGVYTMETFVHATEPEKALSEFFRVLKPGGKIALYEYDHVNMYTAPDDLRESMDQINLHAAMPTNVRFDEGVLQRMLEDTGFEDVHVKDLSVNIRPLLRLFFIIAFLPFLLIRFLGLQACFVNTMSGVEGHRGRNYWRYVAVSAKNLPAECKTLTVFVKERNSGDTAAESRREIGGSFSGMIASASAPAALAMSVQVPVSLAAVMREHLAKFHLYCGYLCSQQLSSFVQ